MNKERGSLIVIEGTDGSGKKTQLDRLVGRLESESKRVETADFPQYGKTFFGDVVGQFLRGEFGQLNQVDPHLASVLYAADRWQAKPQIEAWLNEGIYVVTNRYATSNMAHQAARLPEDKREDFLLWLDELEYRTFGIPREDAVVFLHVPAEIGQQLVAKKSQREYLNGGKADIMEADIDHLREAEGVYLLLAERNNWAQIDCLGESGELLPPSDIHELVYLALQERKII